MFKGFKSKFLGNAAAYSLSPLISKLLTFILIPLYTTYLTPADYGNLQYIMMFGAFLRSTSQLGLNSAFWKFRTDMKGREKEISLNLTLNQFGIGILLLVVFVIGTLLVKDYSNIMLFIAIYYFALIIKTFSENMLLFSRANFNPRKYLQISLTQVVFVLVLNILFVKYLDLNFEGIIYSYLISFVIITVIYHRVLLNEFEGRYNWKLSKEMISYGVPIMIGNLGLMILSLSDRWFIKYYQNDTELGLYSYGYKYADLVLVFLVQVFNLSFLPIAWKIKNSENARRYMSTIRSLIYFTFPVLTVFGLGILFILADLMTKNTAYMEGLNIIGLIAFSHVFYAFYLFHSLTLQFESKTRVILFCNIVAVVTNVALNMYLIPEYSYLGASIATVASYFIMLLVTLLYSIKYYKLEINIVKTVVHYLFVLLAVHFLTNAFYSLDGLVVYKFLLSIGVAILLAGLLWITSGISVSRVKELRKIELK